MGSNEGDRHLLLRLAIEEIGKNIGEIKKISSFIETDSWGYESLNKYLNAVVIVETVLSPLEILKNTLAIEKSLGRVRPVDGKYEDRPIDIDILLIGDMIIKEPDLIVPHPLMTKRFFVLYPLLEINPEIREPHTGKLYKDYLQLLKMETD